MPERSGTTQKLLSLLLTVCLLVSLLPGISAEGRETPFAAKVAAGTVFYADDALTNETGTLEKDAVVLVTEEKGKADRVTYKREGQKTQSWIPKDAAQLIAATPTDLAPYIPDENLTLTPPALQDETPETPETSETPESPETPETPETPESPESPETPETSSDPSVDENPSEDDPSVIPTDPDVIPTEGEADGDASDVISSGDEVEVEKSPSETPDQPSSEEPTTPDTPETAPSTPTDLLPNQPFATGHLSLDKAEYDALVEQETTEDPSDDAPLSGITYNMVDGELVTTAYIPQFYGQAQTPGDEGTDKTLPEVRDQNPFGTCWAFSAVGGMEIDLVWNHQADVSTINLSEFFVAYFLAHNYTYPKGGMGEDDVTYELYNSGETYLDFGGNNYLAIRILSALIGTTTEADNLYPQDWGERNNEAKPAAIAAQLTSAEVYRGSDREAIKQGIRDHGSVGASIYMINPDTEEYEPNKRRYIDTIKDISGYKVGFSVTHNALYGNVPGTNHDILLVGWDDNFPKEHFLTDSTLKAPSSNGAWLVRNSWGGQGYGVAGYFWISYEDASLSGDIITVYSAENNKDEIDHNVYSYDHGLASSWRVHISEPQAVLVQNFTVHAYEEITAVGVETDLKEPTDRLDLTVEVTAGGETRTGTKPNVGEGFFRIALDNKLSFTEDTVVTVKVIYKARTEGMTIFVPYEGKGHMTVGGELGAYEFTSGQDGGGWTVNGKSQSGDPHIKLYTRDTGGGIKATGITLNKTEIPKAKITDKVQLVATIEPANASNKHVSWTSSDTRVVTVDQQGNLTFIGEGQATITATTSSGGKRATCKITVPVEKPTAIRILGFTANPTTINNANAGSFWFGKTLKITHEFVPAYTTVRDVKWTSSNPSVLEHQAGYDTDTSASFIARGNGKTTIRVQSVADPKIYAEQTIIIDLHRQVTSVSLDRTSASIPVDGNFRLYPTVYPTDADNKNVIWSTSNANIASVNSYGEVYGQHWGTATITATTVDGAKTATCVVTVTPGDLVEAFIFRMYRVCLQRDPDEEGFRYWVDQLNSGKKTGAEAVFNFYDSREMKNRNLPNDQYLVRLYEGIMGRAPDAGGYDYWMERLNAGMSRPFVISGFLTSKEFDLLCRAYGINKGSYSSSEPRDKNLGITGFVSRLYTKLLGRSFDDNGLNYWCAIVLKEPTRATLLKVALDGFLHSKEFTNKHLNDTDYLKVLYRTFLDREAEPDGLAYWLDKMHSGMSRDKVAEGFATSQEFKNIMARYGFNK